MKRSGEEGRMERGCWREGGWNGGVAGSGRKSGSGKWKVVRQGRPRVARREKRCGKYKMHHKDVC